MTSIFKSLRGHKAKLLLFLFLPCSLFADDSTWTSVTGGDFTNAANWGLDGVPEPADRAIFNLANTYTVSWSANITNANASFQAASGTVTLNIGSSTWLLTNSFVLGPGAAQAPAVTLSGGTLLVTNSAGTGTINIGQSVAGTLTLNGGTVQVDRLFASNAALSVLSLNNGNLTTLRGSLLSGDAAIGANAGNTMTWNILGGTNEVRGVTGTLVGDFPGSSDGKGILNISGSGTVLSNASDFYIRNTGVANSLTISNGAKFINGATWIGSHSASSNNGILVTGSGTIWTNSGIMRFGDAGRNQTLVISNGAKVYNTDGYIGFNTSSSNNLVTVTGEGSLWTNTGNIYISSENQKLFITNGGSVASGAAVVGYVAGSRDTLIDVSGNGSLLRNISMYVGSNSLGNGSGLLMIRNGGMLETENIFSGYLNTGNITNFGGIYQFTTASPVIQTNTFANVVLTNGTISYRNVHNADIFNPGDVGKITFHGTDNTFQLNNSTNVLVNSYVFSNGNGQVYQNLKLVNGNPMWRSSNLLIGAGGTLTVSNAAGAVIHSPVSSNVITNGGTIRVVNSTVTFSNLLHVSGAYSSDALATSLFTTNVTVGSDGYFTSGVGGTFKFERDWINPSTNTPQFRMGNAKVIFTNFSGQQHVLNLTNSAALDYGSSYFSGIATAGMSNLGIGTLQLSTDDRLWVKGAFGGSTTNALYVGILNLGSLAYTNNLTLDINIYYDLFFPENNYLLGGTYKLGTGSLIPYGIPEPSSVVLFFLGLGSFLLRFRNRKN